jgi:hypothetical protein
MFQLNSNNLLLLVIAIIVVYVIYKCANLENFAEKHHHHHAHKKHHAHEKHHSATKSEAEVSVKPVPQCPTPAQAQDTELWGVNSANQIWKTTIPCPNNACNWINVPGGLKQVSQGKHDVWGTSPGAWGSIWRCDKPCNGNWINVPGSLKEVSVGHQNVWGVNDNGNIYTCPHTKEAPCTGQWVETNGILSDLSIN